MNEKKMLFTYLLRLSDSSLIMGHRLSEWCGYGPILEEDIAMTNLALDLVGQSRFLYDYAAEVEGKGRTEDDLAFLRIEREYYNLLITELPNGDFDMTMAKQFLFDAYQYYLYEALRNSSDKRLAEFAVKSLKETTYHLRHSSEWIVRMGDGTEESHLKIQKAIDDVWKYTGEMFMPDEVDEAMKAKGIAPDLAEIKKKWDKKVDEVLEEATLTRPQDGWMMEGSRKGIHTENMGFLLSELQYMQRAYPNMTW
jgi:ring-1,2-phenylacetyl-CoA epoxidase subunit PaaC